MTTKQERVSALTLLDTTISDLELKNKGNKNE